MNKMIDGKEIQSKLGIKKVEMNKMLQKLQSCVNQENELRKILLLKQGEINCLTELLPKESKKEDKCNCGPGDGCSICGGNKTK